MSKWVRMHPLTLSSMWSRHMTLTEMMSRTPSQVCSLKLLCIPSRAFIYVNGREIVTCNGDDGVIVSAHVHSNSTKVIITCTLDLTAQDHYQIEWYSDHNWIVWSPDHIRIAWSSSSWHGAFHPVLELFILTLACFGQQSLRSASRCDFVVPHARTAIKQHRAGVLKLSYMVTHLAKSRNFVTQGRIMFKFTIFYNCNFEHLILRYNCFNWHY